MTMDWPADSRSAAALSLPSAAAPGARGVAVLHRAVPGRTRFRLAGLRRNARVKLEVERSLRDVHGVLAVEASALTGNVLVLHAAHVAPDDLLARLQRHAAPPERRREVTPSASTSTRRTPVAPVKPALADGTEGWHVLTTQDLLQRLRSSDRVGLSAQAVAERLRHDGANAFPEPPRRSELAMFLSQFQSLPVALLGASAAVSLATGGLIDAAVILGVVLVNATIGFVTEQQAERTITALEHFTPRSARALRDGCVIDVPVEEVVTGDVLALTPGSYVPADARLLETEQLTIDESALTGESLPITKQAAFIGAGDTPLAERVNLVHRGTMVTGGSGRAVVVATGVRTEIGKIQSLVGETRPPETPMQKQLDRMGTQLVLLGGAICGGVFLLGLLRGFGLLQMLKSAISLAVAAVPEGLPTVATTTLALGIRDMRRHRVLIRHLDAVETLGSVQVLCLDKTGTLTQNRMAAVAVRIAAQHYQIVDGRFVLAGAPIEAQAHDALLQLLRVVALCSEGDVERNEGALKLNGSATEIALLEAALRAGVDVGALRREHPLHHMRHRTETTPYMATVHPRADGRYLVAVKGSPAHVLALCTHAARDGENYELNDTERGAVLVHNEQMAGEALRVLGVAYAVVDDAAAVAVAPLTWLGLIGMADPIRPGMTELMQRFHDAGIETVMITGDQGATAYAIGRELKLANGGHLEILDSTALDKMDPELLAGLVRKTHVFARVSPAHKLQIVQALQRAGKVVAMTGDGINDGPALKAADIGVAMGGGGTDVARSVSDVVIEDDNLHTMVIAVEQGRTIYANIRKALHFLLSTNLSEIEVVVAALALGAGSPLTPMQLLWINLISDIFPGLALALEPPEADVLKQAPRDPAEPIVGKKDFKRLGLESSVISAGALASYGYGVLRYGVGAQANTQAFMTLTLAQLLHAISCRSETTTIFEAGVRPGNKYLNLALGVSFAAQLAAIALPGLRKFLNLAPVGPLDVAVIGAGAALPLLVNELTKISKRPRPLTTGNVPAQPGELRHAK
jgi:Ca2+-transporting ATPase